MSICTTCGPLNHCKRGIIVYFSFVVFVDPLGPLYGPPVKNLWSRSDMAKVRPSNLFLRPLDLFLLCGKATHIFYQDKFSQKLYTFSQKDQFFSCFADINILKSVFSIVRPEMLIFFRNLARDQKSMATPDLDHIRIFLFFRF